MPWWKTSPGWHAEAKTESQPEQCYQTTQQLLQYGIHHHFIINHTFCIPLSAEGHLVGKTMLGICAPSSIPPCHIFWTYWNTNKEASESRVPMHTTCSQTKYTGWPRKLFVCNFVWQPGDSHWTLACMVDMSTKGLDRSWCGKGILGYAYLEVKIVLI